MQRLSELVASSRADFGVRFDQVGERIQLVDDKGAMVSDDRALLVVLDLIAAERRAGRVALPVTTTRSPRGCPVSTGCRWCGPRPRCTASPRRPRPTT
jgi:phosphomannomutase